MAERNMSPGGGFLIQSREGHAGNFEVVFALPEGGLAHYGRANDENGKWYGPFKFGSGPYIGASLIESDFKWDAGRTLGNLEVLATHANGEIHHFWRTNSGGFTWQGPFRISQGAIGAPSLVYTGLKQQGDSSFFATAPDVGGGLQFLERLNSASNPNFSWQRRPTAGKDKYVGCALTLTTFEAYSTQTVYRKTGPGGRKVAAVVCDRGNVHLHMETVVGGGTSYADYFAWNSHAIIGSKLFAELAQQFIGRPALIQGDFGYEDPGAFDRGHYGNLELIVPHVNGGFYHFWRLGGIPLDNHGISWGWGGPAVVPGPVYEEVSMIQSTFGADHGNFEVVARKPRQPGFDFYWRNANGWHGPWSIG